MISKRGVCTSDLKNLFKSTFFLHVNNYWRNNYVLLNYWSKIKIWNTYESIRWRIRVGPFSSTGRSVVYIGPLLIAFADVHVNQGIEGIVDAILNICRLTLCDVPAIRIKLITRDHLGPLCLYLDREIDIVRLCGEWRTPRWKIAPIIAMDKGYNSMSRSRIHRFPYFLYTFPHNSFRRIRSGRFGKFARITMYIHHFEILGEFIPQFSIDRVEMDSNLTTTRDFIEEKHRNLIQKSVH